VNQEPGFPGILAIHGGEYVNECLHNLELSGELIIRHQRGRHGGNLYFPMPEKVIPSSLLSETKVIPSSLLEHEKRCPLDHPKLIKEKERKKETQQTVPAIAIALREKESLAHWITPGTELYNYVTGNGVNGSH
jgi:hypothetical protein